MQLTDDQRRMLDGGAGPGAAKSMAMLVRYGEAFDAERMVRVDSAHVFATDPLEFVAGMLEGVGQVRAPTTIHSAYPTETGCGRCMGIPQAIADRDGAIHAERTRLLTAAGVMPVYSCAPYLVGNLLTKDAVFSWPGSSGIIIGNSLFGARGNRDAGAAALASAITGCTPEMLLLKPENRRADLVVRIEGVDVAALNEADLGAIGYHVGLVAGIRNVAITGFERAEVPFDRLKYLLSPMPVSGAVSLAHIVGVTPEAPTLDAVLDPSRPAETIRVGPAEIALACARLHTATTDRVDTVLVGCPHCTAGEIARIAALLDGRRVADGVRLIVSTSDGIRTLAERMGAVAKIERAGGHVINDTCVMNTPFPILEREVKASATNSARAAHYHQRGGVSGGGGVEVLYGDIERCVAAAVAGRWST